MVMQAEWLRHLLADRGIHLSGVTKASIVSGPKGLMLDVEGLKANEQGRPFALYTDADHQREPAIERHVVPIGGMVLERAG